LRGMARTPLLAPLVAAWLGNRLAVWGVLPAPVLAGLAVAAALAFLLLAYAPAVRRARSLRALPRLFVWLALAGGMGLQGIGMGLDPDVPPPEPGWYLMRPSAAPVPEGRTGSRMPARWWGPSAEGLTRRHGILLRFRDATPPPGAHLLLWCAPRSPEPREGPWAFPARAWLAGMGLRSEARIEPGAWRVLPRRNPTLALCARARDGLLERLRAHVPDRATAGLLEALALGWKADLETGTREAFARTGTLHVLAVSGLHLGLVGTGCLALERALGRVRRRRRGAAGNRSGWLALPAVWAFAGLTGAGPSVVRAAVLFSFWTLGRWQGRGASSWNGWCAAALFLLALRPWVPDAVGARLSFAAVGGILAFYRPLRRRLSWRGRLGGGLADLLALSTAAQAGSLPVAWMAFGRLPAWFLLGNLVAVPAAGLLLPATLLLPALSAWPGLASGWGGLLTRAVAAWMGLNERLARLPELEVPPLPEAAGWVLLAAFGGVALGLASERPAWRRAALALTWATVLTVQVRDARRRHRVRVCWVREATSVEGYLACGRRAWRFLALPEETPPPGALPPALLHAGVRERLPWPPLANPAGLLPYPALLVPDGGAASPVRLVGTAETIPAATGHASQRGLFPPGTPRSARARWRRGSGPGRELLPGRGCAIDRLGPPDGLRTVKPIRDPRDGP
jgi:ComEC/Rec2-related protein